jgi:hypothetical protein
MCHIQCSVEAVAALFYATHRMGDGLYDGQGGRWTGWKIDRMGDGRYATTGMRGMFFFLTYISLVPINKYQSIKMNLSL